jgi:hypothetical protein
VRDPLAAVKADGVQCGDATDPKIEILTGRRQLMTRRVLVLVALSLAFLATAYAADVAGKWTAEFETPIGLLKYTYDFKVDGAKLTGKATFQQGSTDIQEGKVSGDDIFFVELMKFEDQSIRIEYKGKVSGDEIKFSRKVGDFGGEDFVAKRVK